MAPRIKCPAGQERHPVLSANPLDVECRIMGNMQPAVSPSTGEVAICCAEYQKCRVWRTAKELELGGPSAHSTKRMRDQLVGRRAPDTLDLKT